MTFGRLNCGRSLSPSSDPTSDGRFLWFFETLSPPGACNSSERLGEMAALSREKQATLLASDPNPGAVPACELGLSSSDACATHAEGANGSASAGILRPIAIFPKVGLLSSLSRLTAPEMVLRRREKGLEVRGRTEGGRGCMGAWRTWLRGVKIERGVVSAALAVESFMWAPHYWRVELSLFSVMSRRNGFGRQAGGQTNGGQS